MIILDLFFYNFCYFALLVSIAGCFFSALSLASARKQKKHMEEMEIKEETTPPSEIDGFLNQGKPWLYEQEMERLYEYSKKGVSWDPANWEANIANTHPTPYYTVISIFSYVLVIMGLLGTLYAIISGINKAQGDLFPALRESVELAAKTSFYGIFFGSVLMLLAGISRRFWENTLELLKEKVRATFHVSKTSELQDFIERVNGERQELLELLKNNITDMKVTLETWQTTFTNDLRDTNKLVQQFTKSLDDYKREKRSDYDFANRLLSNIERLQTLIHNSCSRLETHEEKLCSRLEELNQTLQQINEEPTQQEQEG